MADPDVREPPPKPSRIRTASNKSAHSYQGSHSGNTSPLLKTPVPLPRPARAPSQDSEPEQGISLVNGNSNPTPQPRPMLTADSLGARSPVKGPVPPPKPKRISLAPQPRAKPANLQSVPLQKQDPAPVQMQPPVKPAPPPPRAKIRALYGSQELLHLAQGQTQGQHKGQDSASGSEPANGSLVQQPNTDHTFSPPPSSPSFPSRDLGSTGVRAATGCKDQMGFVSPSTPERRAGIESAPLSMSSSLPSGSNPTLFTARSRLRSTSDAKSTPSVAVLTPQPSNNQSAYSPLSTSQGHDHGGRSSIGVAEGRYHTGPSLSPTYPPAPYTHRSNNNCSDPEEDPHTGTTLTASLHKIHALAQEQTGRMKQINYNEKKTDLAEVVYEKSSLWRARGAEWGGIARKAWEDRGGMGGIAGGLADRWKRRDEVNGPTIGRPRLGVTEQIFGLALGEAVRYSRISASTGVPAVVTRCIEYLDVMGVEEVGLYRVPGSTSNVARLKALFDSGLDHDFLQKGNEPQNPHDVATLLKLYLRELPMPIIPAENMPAFSSIDFTATNHTAKLKDALRNLPLENYILLGTLCRHLSNLADYEACTKMNISNLGLIFCPTLQIGSVLFKNLLGGDGGADERQKYLQAAWKDLERKHEEMENLEMIKDFELGLEFERANGIVSEENLGMENDWDGKRADEHDLKSNHDRVRSSGGQDGWEDVGQAPYSATTANGVGAMRDSMGDSPSSQLHHSGHLHDSPYQPQRHQHSRTAAQHYHSRSTEPTMDLYDELMTKELNEATNTPLIDFGQLDEQEPARSLFHRVEEDEDLKEILQWRRHAREPATNHSTASATTTTTAAAAAAGRVAVAPTQSPPGSTPSSSSRRMERSHHHPPLSPSSAAHGQHSTLQGGARLVLQS